MQNKKAADDITRENNMEEEVWKDIPGYVGYYKASNLGRVKGLDRVVQDKLGRSVPIKSTILSYSYKKGYRQVHLNKTNVRKRHPVHQLVAMAFLDHVPCRMQMVVVHIDEYKTNNRLDNLQLMGNRENVHKSKQSGLPMGVVNSYSKKKPFRSRLRIGGKTLNLGNYVTAEEAHQVYLNKLEELGEGL